MPCSAMGFKRKSRRTKSCKSRRTKSCKSRRTKSCKSRRTKSRKSRRTKSRKSRRTKSRKSKKEFSREAGIIHNYKATESFGNIPKKYIAKGWWSDGGDSGSSGEKYPHSNWWYGPKKNEKTMVAGLKKYFDKLKDEGIIVRHRIKTFNPSE